MEATIPHCTELFIQLASAFTSQNKQQQTPNEGDSRNLLECMEMKGKSLPSSLGLVNSCLLLMYGGEVLTRVKSNLRGWGSSIKKKKKTIPRGVKFKHPHGAVHNCCNSNSRGEDPTPLASKGKHTHTHPYTNTCILINKINPLKISISRSQYVQCYTLVKMWTK